jgi:Helix-turn-helix domain
MDHLTTDFNTLKNYATFESIHEMDNVIYTYIDRLRADEQPESVIEVLRFFGRSSLRILGVSFAKYDTIASDIGYSKRTVIRAVNTLVSYGMITKTPTLKRWAGRSLKRSVNVVSIIPNAPIEQVSRQAVTAGAPDEPASSNDSTVDTQSEPIVFKHVNNTVLDSLLRPYFNDTTVHKLTRVVYRAKASVNRSLRIETYTAEVRACILACIRRLKTGQIRKLDDYLYVAIQRLFRRVQAVKMNAVFLDVFA